MYALLLAKNADEKAVLDHYADIAQAKYEDALTTAHALQKAIDQVNVAVKAGSPDLYDALEPAMKRITTAHAMLELEGVSLPPFRRPKRPEARIDWRSFWPTKWATFAASTAVSGTSCSVCSES